MTREERAGLKSLKMRMKKEEIVIMKTDKSGRFLVTTPEEYLKMGEVHTEKDKEITWEEVKDLEKEIGAHTTAWSLIWNVGQDHNHTDRIIKSKVTRSGSQANLNLLYKDHKDGRKTRPVATGNESYNLGLSNAVSEVLESVARAEEKPYSVISAEDMLARVNRYNRVIEKKNEEWKVLKAIKLDCKRCKILEKVCSNHESREKYEKLVENENMEEIEKCVKNVTNSACCRETVNEIMKVDCKICGKGLSRENTTLVLIGNDVVALYPSIKSKNTGKIVKKGYKNLSYSLRDLMTGKPEPI